jgi:DNA-entry nuclease
MLPFENMVADFVIATEIHVMYRVTPIYEGYNLVASGVLIEALSVEDGGEGIRFCVYVYNVQPGIEINYFNGTNRLSGAPNTEGGDSSEDAVMSFIINTESKKIHKDSCGNGKKTSEKNREDFSGTVDELLAKYKGYDACGICKPFESTRQIRAYVKVGSFFVTLRTFYRQYKCRENLTFVYKRTLDTFSCGNI